jgi:hypothetical protein
MTCKVRKERIPLLLWGWKQKWGTGIRQANQLVGHPPPHTSRMPGANLISKNNVTCGLQKPGLAPCKRIRQNTEGLIATLPCE